VIETIHTPCERAKRSSVEADPRAMDHRAHVAGPPPLRRRIRCTRRWRFSHIGETDMDRDGRA